MAGIALKAHVIQKPIGDRDFSLLLELLLELGIVRGDPGLLQGSDGGPSRNDLAQRVKFVQAGNSARLLGRDELFLLQGFYVHVSEPGVC